MQRGQRPASQPFVTRRSTLGFSAVFVLSALVFQTMSGGDASASGATGAVVATALALAVVTGAVAWFAGIVLALRANSLLWLVIAVLPFVPINSVVCAMFCPAAPAAKKP
jgi:hypothetical protein